MKHLLPALLIIIVSFTIYGNTLSNGFVYDDKYTIVNNSLITDINNLPLLFKKEYFTLSDEVSYRPVVTLTYFIDYLVFGRNPVGYHLSNTLLHAINGILLYIFLILVSQSTTNIRHSAFSRLFNLPVIITILFISHPVLTEAVNAISYREDLLVFLFYMGTLNLFIMLKKVDSFVYRGLIYFISCIVYIFALLSKEMAVTLPLVICCHEWLNTKKNKNGNTSLFGTYNMGYIVIMIIYTFSRFYVFVNPLEKSSFNIPPLDMRLLTIPWLMLSYIKLMSFPIQLSATYGIAGGETVFSSFFLFPLTILISAISFILWDKDKKIVFGTLFFLLTLVPVYNIVPLINPMAERYLYLSAAGFIIAAGSIANRILEAAMPRNGRGLTLIIGLTVFICYAVTVIERNRIWNNDYDLWSDAVRKKPYNSKAHNNLGTYYLDHGRLNEALWELNIAVSLTPASSDSHHNLGGVYYKLNRFEEAIREFKTSLKLNPNNTDARFNLGIIYTRIGRPDEAIYEYAALLRLNPYHVDARYNLGTLYAETDEIEKAIGEFKFVLKLNPGSAETHYNLGLLYRKTGLEEMATKEFEIASKMKVTSHRNGRTMNPEN